MRLFLFLTIFFAPLSFASPRGDRCVCQLGLGDRIKWTWESLGSDDPAGTAFEYLHRAKKSAICITPQPALFTWYQAATLPIWVRAEEARLRRWYGILMEKAGIRHLEKLVEFANTPIEVIVIGSVTKAEMNEAMARLNMIHSMLTEDALDALVINELRNPSLHVFLDKFPHLYGQLDREFPSLLRMVNAAREHADRLGHW